MRYCDTVLIFLFAAIVELNEGWQYAQVSPHAPRPVAESAWAHNFEPRAEVDRWYRITLPANVSDDAHLVFRS